MKRVITFLIFVLWLSTCWGQEMPEASWIEELSKIILGIAEKSPIAIMILSILGSLVVVGQTVVVITPTKKDDQFLEENKNKILGMIIKLFESFAVIRKK